MTRVVGIGLFRDEDRFVERAVRSVFGFCDELILVDHRSRDRTPEILERLAAESPVRSEEHTSELQSQSNLVCRLLLEKKKLQPTHYIILSPLRMYTVSRLPIRIESSTCDS